MAVVATMAQTSTSQPDLWKPRYAARQHQEQQQQVQKPTRSRSLREPFDAAELTRKLENYRQELKLEKARRELAKKGDMAPMQAAATSQKETAIPVAKTSTPGVSRAKTAHNPDYQRVTQEPERKRSILHRKPKQEIKEDIPEHAAGPYVPRVAARQFASTTTPLKKKKKEESSAPQQPEPKVKDTSNKHKLDWDEPALHHRPDSTSPPPPEALDAETTQKRIHALHAFRDASKSRPRPLSTALENLRVWDHDGSNAYMPQPVHEEAEPVRQSEEFAPPTHRPQLKQGDRHDWSQASQCGDSARQSLHLFRRKDVGNEEAEMVGVRAGAKQKPRQRSHGDAGGDRLVSDAVKLIREERRRSILGIFRRH